MNLKITLALKSSFLLALSLNLTLAHHSYCAESKHVTTGQSLYSEGNLMTDQLRTLVPQDRFFLTQAEAVALSAKLNLTMDELMIQLIPIVKERSRPLLSGYQVGVVGKAYPSGNLIFGVNLEFPRQALNQSVHGEQFAISLGHAMGEERFESFALSAASCGHCRQFINELPHASEIRFLLPHKTFTLSQLLPDAFGPHDLGIQANLMSTKQNEGKLPLSSKNDSAIQAAYQAALQSYSPYTKNPAGVALVLNSGEILTGSYLENVAFNPSLSPFQSALVNLVAHKRDYSHIKHLVLVERAQSDQISSQEPATRALLEVLAPLASMNKITMKQ